ncbi:MAG: hypothetical protein ACKO0Z_06890 [Betaproteobacteria bacterium]
MRLKIFAALLMGGTVAALSLDVWRAYQVDSAIYEVEQAHKRLDEALRSLHVEPFSNGADSFSNDDPKEEIRI